MYSRGSNNPCKHTYKRNLSDNDLNTANEGMRTNRIQLGEPNSQKTNDPKISNLVS